MFARWCSMNIYNPNNSLKYLELLLIKYNFVMVREGIMEF